MFYFQFLAPVIFQGGYLTFYIFEALEIICY